MSYNFDELYGAGTVTPAKQTKQTSPSGFDFDQLAPANVKSPAALESSMFIASLDDPERLGKTTQLTKAWKELTGEELSPRIVEPNELARKLRRRTNEEALKTSPTLSRLFEDPKFAGLAFDDVEQLSTIEKITSAAKGVVKATASGVPSMVGGLYGAAAFPFELLSDAGGNKIPYDPLGKIGGFLKGASSTLAKTTKDVADVRPDATIFERGIASGFQSLGQNLPPLIGALITKNPSLALGVMGTSAGGQSYTKAREEGLPAYRAAQYGATDAAIEIVTESFPVLRLFKDIGVGTPFVKTLIVNQVQEQLGEQAATVLQDFNEWAVLNPEKPFTSYLEARPSAALETAIATVIGSGGQVTLLKAVDKATSMMAKREEQGNQAQVNLQQFTDLMAATEAAQLRARDVDAFQGYLKALGDESGSNELFLDPNTLQQSGIDLNLLQQVLPSVAEQLAQPDAGMRDIVIPRDEFFARLPGSGLEQSLLPLVRAEQDGLSAKEAETELKEAATFFQAETEKAIQQEQVDIATQQSQQVVEQDMLRQLKEANRFTDDVNGAYAKLMSAFFGTLSARMNKAGGMLDPATGKKRPTTAEEQYRQFALRVNAQSVAGDQQLDQNTPEFQSWFEGSKVVDATGKPLRVFHGTAGDFTTFEAGRQSNTEGGSVLRSEGVPAFYFTSSKSVADGFAEAAERNDAAPRVVEAYLSLKNPLVIEAEGRGWPQFEQQVVEAYRSGAHDGVILRGLEDGMFETEVSDVYVAFKPEQIKSTTNARPTDSPNIMEQSASLRRGTETLKRFGLDPTKKHNVRQVASALEARQRAKYGSVARDDRSAPTARKLAKWMVEEVLFEAQNPGASGVGWYSTKFQQALDILAGEFPELATDQNARDTMTALIAVTSDGQKVNENFLMAVEVYGNFRTTGEFKSDRGHARDSSIKGNLAKIQELHAKLGAEGMRELLMREITVGEINKAARAAGEKVSSDYTADTKMPVAATVFGPKLGAFYANLMGSSGYLTMDRWWSRTFNRYRGTLVAAPTRQGLDRFKELIGRPELSDDQAIAETVQYRKSYEARNFKEGTEIEKAANTIYKAAFEALEDAPFNATDRGFMIQTVKYAQQNLARRGIEMSIADIQAVLWYYEKRLYGDLGARQSADVSYEEAARRAVAARTSGDTAGGALSDATDRLDPQPAEGPAPGEEPYTGGTGSGADGENRLHQGWAGREPGLVAASAVARQAARGVSKLVGLPDLPIGVGGEWYIAGPVGVAHDAARDYVEGAGQPYTPVRNYVPVDEARAKRIAAAFDEMKHSPNDPEVKAAYRAMIDETLAQYQIIKATGLKIEFITGADPYAESPRQAIVDVVQNNHLWVFPTDNGFGSSGADVSGNPLLELTDEYIDGKRLRANDVFRIVHDYFGHIKDGNGFRAEGEENAWRSHSAMYSPLARRAMTAETRGQNSWVNYGPQGEKNRKANAAETVYADQKIGLLPEWVSEEGRTDAVPAQSLASYGTRTPGSVSVVGVHFSLNPLSLVSTGTYGTNAAGAERSRVSKATDKRLRTRSFFYVNEGQGVKAEKHVGSVAHVVRLENLYDVEADPLRIWDGKFLNNSESAILDAGFDGYYSRNSFTTQGTVTLLGDHAVPVTKAGFETDANALIANEVAPDAKYSVQRQVASMILNSKGIPAGRLTPAEWKAKIDASMPDVSKKLPAEIFAGNDPIYRDDLVRTLFQGDRPRELKPSDFKGRTGDVVIPAGTVLYHGAHAERAAQIDASGKLLGKSPYKSSGGLLSEGGMVWFGDADLAARHSQSAVDPTAAGDRFGKGAGKVYEVITGRPLKLMSTDIVFTKEQAALLNEALGIPDYKQLREGDGTVAATNRAFNSSRTVDRYQTDRGEMAAIWPKITEVLGYDGYYDDSGIAVARDSVDAGGVLFQGEQTRQVQGLDAVHFVKVLPKGVEVSEAGRQWTPEKGDGFNSVASAKSYLGRLLRKTGWPVSTSWEISEYEGGASVYFIGETNSLEQGEQARGQITFGNDITQTPSVITLLKNADLSTFLHEAGHFYLEVMTNVANQPNAPQEIVDDMNKLFKWFNVPGGLGEWNSMTLDQKRASHEKFARGFEAYLFEGKAPSVELKGAFSRFRAWMVNVYRNLAGLNVQLDDTVRGVFDRMLATEEQIKEAEALRGFTPIFKSAEEMGATPEEWAAYQNLHSDATENATEQLQARSLRDMQWLANTRARSLRKLQRDAESKRKAVEAEVTAEVQQEKVYAVQKWLKTGVLPDGTQTVGAKLDLAALKEMYGEDPAAPWRYLSNGVNGLAGNEGLHPDQVAEMFGYSSGDSLVKAILAADPESTVIEGMTDQRMLERYGDLSSPAGLEKAANEAVHNEARGRFIATELAALNSAMSVQQDTGRTVTDSRGRTRKITTNVMVKAAKDFAGTLIERSKIKDIKPAQYASAEGRAAKNAERTKNFTEKVTEKRNQLVNHYAARAANDAVDYIEKQVAYLKKIGDSETIDQEYRDQIQQLLEKVELRRVTEGTLRKRASLLEWIEKQEAQGLDPVIDRALVESAQVTNYRTMTLEEFRGLVDTVKNIEHLGRLKHKLLTAKDGRDLAQAVEEMRASVEANHNREAKVRIETGRGLEKIGRMARGFVAMHRKFASIAREMDGGKDGGRMWERLVRPMNEAGDNEVTMRSQATDKLAEIFKLLDGIKLTRKEVVLPGVSMTREARIMMALNWGNEGNRQRVIDGGLDGRRRLSQAEAEQIVFGLSGKEWDFVESMWAFVESYRPMIAEQEKRLTGVEPKWVEPTPFRTPQGRDIKGGYFPAKYDGDLSTRSNELEAVTDLRQQMMGAAGRSATRNGYTKERSEAVKDRPLRKDFGVIMQHVSEVTHRLAWQDWLIDARRLLNAKPLDSAIREFYGPEILKEMKSQLMDIAQGDIGAQSDLDRILGHVRSGVTIAGMGWNLMTGMMQPLGLSQSIVRVGAADMARGLAHFAANPIDATKLAQAKSKFMASRSLQLNRDLSDILNRIDKEKISNVEASYFWFIYKFQTAIDVPTWWGAYEKAIAENNDEARSIALADQAVIDAQGGGTLKDQARIQRGGAGQKLFTAFYSFFNTTYNLAVEQGRTAAVKGGMAVPKLASDYLMLLVIPAMAGALLKALVKGELDDDELLKKLLAEQLNYLFGTMVLLREIGGGISAAMNGFSYTGPASLRVFGEVAKLAKQAEQGEIDQALLRSLNSIAGIVLHYPAGQVQRTVEGFNALYEGETSNPAALLFGAPRN